MITSLIDEYKNSKEKMDKMSKHIPDIEKAEQTLGLKHISEKDVEHIIDNIISEKREYIMQRGTKAFNPIMGLIMKELRGKADGEIVSKLLKTKMNEILKK